MKKELTAKERLFAFEYLADEKLNPERAAIRAGYAASVARTKAYQWVKKSNENPKNHVAGFIEELMKQRQINLERIIKRFDEEIINLCFSDLGKIIQQMGNEINIRKINCVKPELRAAIAGIVVTDKGSRIILHSKPKAMQLMGKRLGLWINKDDDLAFMPHVITGNDQERNQ